MSSTLNDAVEATTGDSVARCHLLELPAELRNHIFELAVVTKSLIHVNPWTLATHPVQSALTQTNQQIRSECLPILFSQNTFEIDPTYSHHQNRARLPQSTLQMSHLKHVIIRLRRCPQSMCFYSLDLSGPLNGSCLTLERRCDGTAKCNMATWFSTARRDLDDIGSLRKMTKHDLGELVELLL